MEDIQMRKEKKLRNFIMAIIFALAGGYCFQTIVRLALSLYIFGDVSLTVLIPNWSAIVGVLLCFYFCLPIFNLVNGEKWKKFTIFSGVGIAFFIWGFVIGFLLTM